MGMSDTAVGELHQRTLTYPPLANWVRRARGAWDEATFKAAATGGNVAVLIWLLDRRCPRRDMECVRAAAPAGHTHVLEWMLENLHKAAITSCLVHRDVRSVAAQGGHLVTL